MRVPDELTRMLESNRLTYHQWIEAHKLWGLLLSKGVRDESEILERIGEALGVTPPSPDEPPPSDPEPDPALLFPG